MELQELSPACGEPGTDTAQRFLTSAFESVEPVFQTLRTVRRLRREETGDIRGRLTSPEEDLLRAAVVFTGAALDAALKQLIRDMLPVLLERNEQAHEKFEAFAADRLGTGEIADTKMIARHLTSPDPRARLIEDYIYELTGSSLQSAEEVQKTAGGTAPAGDTASMPSGPTARRTVSPVVGHGDSTVTVSPISSGRKSVSQAHQARTSRPGSRMRCGIPESAMP